MAQSLLKKAESDYGNYPWDRVFVLPVDAIDGVFRVLYSDPKDLMDTRDLIYESFADMPLWGSA